MSSCHCHWNTQGHILFPITPLQRQNCSIKTKSITMLSLLQDACHKENGAESDIDILRKHPNLLITLPAPDAVPTNPNFLTVHFSPYNISSSCLYKQHFYNFSFGTNMQLIFNSYDFFCYFFYSVEKRRFASRFCSTQVKNPTQINDVQQYVYFL